MTDWEAARRASERAADSALAVFAFPFLSAWELLVNGRNTKHFSDMHDAK